jgi:ArsR family transcriptional regulator
MAVQVPSLPAAVAPLRLDQAHPLLRALADPIRLRVLVALGDGERCVCDLTTALGLAQSRLSFHLKALKDAGLISARQQGRWMYYRLQPLPLLALRDWLGNLARDCDGSATPCGSLDRPPPPHPLRA